MIKVEVRSAIEEVLKASLSDIGYESAEILEDEDHDGDPIFRITIHYRKVGEKVDPSPTFGLVRRVKEALEPLGETRFPHFTHLFPEDQTLAVA